MSAEQGKIIGQEVFGGYFSLLAGLSVVSNMAYLSDLSAYDYGGTQCNRYNPINVVAYRGQTIRIKAFVPSGMNVASGFVDANNKSLLKISYDTNAYQEFVIPDTAKELRLCFSWNYSASAEIKSKSLSDKIAELSDALAQPFYPFFPTKGLKGKAVGDSITAGTNGGVSYVGKVATALGITYENAGQAGATIRTMTDNFLNKVTDADFVTLFGGTNEYGLNGGIGSLGDSADKRTLYGDLQNALNVHKSTNPNVPLILITPCKRYDSDTNTNGLSLGDYVDAIIKFCHKNKLMVIDLYNTGLVANSTFCISDKVHLNNAGATELANYIADKLPYYILANRVWK